MEARRQGHHGGKVTMEGVCTGTFSARLSHRLNRKFVWTDLILHKILKRQQQPSLYVKLATTREQSFSLQIHESKCG